MSKSADPEAQIIGEVKHVEAGQKVEEVAREMKYRRTRSTPGSRIWGENARLKKLVADLSLRQMYAAGVQ